MSQIAPPVARFIDFIDFRRGGIFVSGATATRFPRRLLWSLTQSPQRDRPLSRPLAAAEDLNDEPPGNQEVSAVDNVNADERPPPTRSPQGIKHRPTGPSRPPSAVPIVARAISGANTPRSGAVAANGTYGGRRSPHNELRTTHANEETATHLRLHIHSPLGETPSQARRAIDKDP